MIIESWGFAKFPVNEDMKEWFINSFTKICVGCNSEAELEMLYAEAKLRDLPCILITDNGTTEFNGVPTKTCIAIGPAQSEDIDKITGHLKLL
jgi:PTH2 family peptidyl-tRNA hydrolase